MMRALLALLLAGGCGLTEPPRPNDGGARRWNLAQTEMPGAWHGAKLTWDRTRGGVVMYGGRHAATDTEDGKVFLWKSNQWTQICKNGTPPSPRYLPGFAWNPITSKLTLAGGSLDGAKFQTLSTEVWTCDDATDTWMHESQITTARAGADLVWNDAKKLLMLIGGRDVSFQERTIETSPDGVVWSRYPSDLPFDCAGAGQNVTYDTTAHALYALAGELSAGTIDPLVYHDEIWRLGEEDTDWGEICEHCSGTPRSDASIVHLGGDAINDTNENYVVGGYIGGGDDVEGTWLMSNDQLVRIGTLDLQKRNGVGIAWNGVSDTLIAFGGVGQSCPQRFDGECDQTYEYLRK